MNSSNLDKLVSKETSQWKEHAETRMKERDWKKNSRAVAIAVLSQLKAKNLSQTDLANAMGVSRQQVSKIVKGQENLTFETVSKLEKALDITIMKISNKLSEENATQIRLPLFKVEPQLAISQPVSFSKGAHYQSTVLLSSGNTFATFHA